VLHLAAQSLVQRSYRHPVATYQTNVMGTINLLESVRDTPSVRTVVIATMDKCYENQEWAQHDRVVALPEVSVSTALKVAVFAAALRRLMTADTV
jgi:CDP-glucose 4,6-dehydratase